MDNIREKPVIGILGGIGSGKSTVAAEFAKLGCKVIDADKIAHELLDEQRVKEIIIGIFGQAILDSAGKIDREKLAEVVFDDAGNQKSEIRSQKSEVGNQKSMSALCLLSSVLHPLVLQRAEELMEQYNRQNQVKAIVLDMPLLVEVGWDKRCDKLIFVDCRQKLRLDRAKKMGFDKNQV